MGSHLRAAVAARHAAQLRCRGAASSGGCAPCSPSAFGRPSRRRGPRARRARSPVPRRGLRVCRADVARLHVELVRAVRRAASGSGCTSSAPTPRSRVLALDHDDRSAHVFNQFNVRSTPYLVTVDRDGKVQLSGVANSLEQAEVMLDESVPLRSRLTISRLDGSIALSPRAGRWLAAGPRGGRSSPALGRWAWSSPAAPRSQECLPIRPRARVCGQSGVSPKCPTFDCCAPLRCGGGAGTHAAAALTDR